MSDDTIMPTDEVAYENTADLVWARKALDLYHAQLLKVQAFDTEGVVSAQVWGSCPRCGHDLNVQQTLTTPIPGLRGDGWWATFTGRQPSGESGIPHTVEVGCGCEHSHPGAPGQDHGCGVSFTLPSGAPSAAPESS